MSGKIIRHSLATFCVLSVFSSTAFADMSAPYGWYLEGNFGSSKISNVSYPGDYNTSGIGGNVNLGYKFMPYFALEAGYTQYNNITIKNNAGTEAAEVRNFSYDLAMRGIIPYPQFGLELFAKLGVARANARPGINNQTVATQLGIANSQSSVTGGYLGVGGQYFFMPELGVVVQWQRAQGNSTTGTMDLFSGGFVFIFD